MKVIASKKQRSWRPDLVRRQIAVIATLANGAQAAKAATTTIPLVFLLADDPVKAGLVASLARPGGNLTGLNFLSAELVAKRLELVRELVPAATRVAVLVDPTGPNSRPHRETRIRLLAPSGWKSSSSMPAPAERSMRPSPRFVRGPPDALFVDIDPFFTSRRVQLVNLATR
jgi:putative tryptophan/tyrosine transport system substrate-binding protein